MVVEKGRAAMIHPMWWIEEYARRGRRWDWLKAPLAPTKALKEARVRINIILMEKNRKLVSTKGAIFWIVVSNQQVGHGLAFMTLGNQKWHGAIPSFIVREIIIRMGIIGDVLENRAAVNKIIEAVAWARKYFKAASFSKWLDVWRIKGIKE